MADIPGNNVGAMVTPFTTEDDYATHAAKYGQGGVRTVADEAARDAITLKRREWWMLVRYLSDGSTWELVPGLNSNDLADNDNWRPAPNGLTAEQAQQLAVSGAVVRVTRAGAEDHGYPSLAEARDTEYEQEEDLEGRLFLAQRATSVSTLVDLSQASGLVGQRTQVGVDAGGELVLPVLVDGLSLRSFGSGIIRFLPAPCTAHNCFIYGITIPAGGVLTVLDTEFSSTLCYIAGTLIIGAGSGQRNLAAFLANYTDNGDGTYSTGDGGTILDARGGSGGPAVTVRDVYAVSAEKRAQVISQFSGSQFFAANVLLSGETYGEVLGKKFADKTNGDVYECLPDFEVPDTDQPQDENGNHPATPTWFRY